MPRTVREFAASQNPALGALLLTQFVAEFPRSRYEDGPLLVHAMPVLPLLYREEVARQIKRKNYAGGLLRLLREDRTIVIGLDRRMRAMSSQTFRALNLAFASRLLELMPSTGTLRRDASRLTPVDDEAAIVMMAASKRLGRWFGELSLAELCMLLDLSF